MFIGRLPGFAADFLGGYLQWQARVGAYTLLLTGVYPPFTLGDADYPARVGLRPGRLNRLAVLFRLVLSVPASIVAALLYGGACILGLTVAWLIVLTTGRMPGPLHEAMAATLRYLTRLSGYLFLLTSSYPAGLFGDPPDREPAAAAFTAGPGGFAGPVGGFAPDPVDAAAPDVTTVPAEPGGPSVASDPVTPDGFTAAAAPAAPAAGAATNPPLPAAADPAPACAVSAGLTGPGWDPAGAARGERSAVAGPWRLVLSSTAKGLLALFLAAGAVVLIGFTAATVSYAAHVGSSAGHATAERQVQTAFTPPNQAMNSFAADTAQCRGAARPLACVTAADRDPGAHFATFAAELREISVPPGAARRNGGLTTRRKVPGESFSVSGE